MDNAAVHSVRRMAGECALCWGKILVGWLSLVRAWFGQGVLIKRAEWRTGTPRSNNDEQW